MRKPAVRSARRSRALALACGIAATLAAAAADAQRIREGEPRGPAAKAERPAPAATAVSAVPPPPPPPAGGGGVGAGGLPFPGPVRLPGEGGGIRPMPGPNNTSSSAPAGPNAGLASPGQVGALGATAGGRSIGLGVAPATIVPILVPPGPGAKSESAPAAMSRITEIIPPTIQSAAVPQAGRDPARSGQDIRAAAAATDSCVTVYLRRVKVDGREVLSVDLHGDGLVKGATPPQLAGELLARAGAPSPNGTRAACVTPALAQSLFAPVINIAAVEPAVRMARDGDRWVLAGTPAPAVRSEPPQQLASATTTRGGVKSAPKKRAPPQPKPAHWIHP